MYMKAKKQSLGPIPQISVSKRSKRSRPSFVGYPFQIVEFGIIQRSCVSSRAVAASQSDTPPVCVP